MTLYEYSTNHHIRYLTDEEYDVYEELVKDDWHGTGAVDGAFAGLPGTTVYVM
jgi:hypothetical protein